MPTTPPERPCVLRTEDWRAGMADAVAEKPPDEWPNRTTCLPPGGGSLLKSGFEVSPTFILVRSEDGSCGQ